MGCEEEWMEGWKKEGGSTCSTPERDTKASLRVFRFADRG